MSHPPITHNSGAKDIIKRLRDQPFDIRLIHVDGKIADVMNTEVESSQGLNATDVVEQGAVHTLFEQLAYRIYDLSTGEGAPPRFLLSPHGFALGYRRGRFRYASVEELYFLDPPPPVLALRAMAKLMDVSTKMTVDAITTIHDPVSMTVKKKKDEEEKTEDGPPVPKKKKQVLASSGVLWNRLIDKHRTMPFFIVECIEPTCIEQEAIDNVSPDTWKELVDFAVSANYVPDDSLLTIYKPGLISLGDDIPITMCDLRSFDVMKAMQKTAPHSLVVGPTKCGKTEMALAVNAVTNLGAKYGKASSAGAVGFISVDKSRKGSLNEAAGLVCFDEITSYKNYDIFSSLFSLMEQGTDSITQAGAAQSTRTLATMSFVSNAVEKDKVSSFTKTMGFITENAEGFGSRLGFIGFQLFEPSTRLYTDVDNDDVLNVQHLIRIVLLRSQNKINELFKYLESMDWFGGPPPGYCAHIQEKIQTWGSDTQMYKLWLHHTNANNRHIKGAAFRLWAAEELILVDRTNAGDDLLKYVLKEIKPGRGLSQRLTRVIRINRESLEYMLDVVGVVTPEEMQSNYAATSKIDQVIISACGSFQAEHATDGKVHEIPFETLWIAVRDLLGDKGLISESSSWYYPSSVFQKLSPRALIRLRKEWGIQLTPLHHLVTLMDTRCAELWVYEHEGGAAKGKS
tara:strand:+ start:2503 stop:4551 length:2049 start_codon:yes stop_codon:yes gene_type:complete